MTRERKSAVTNFFGGRPWETEGEIDRRGERVLRSRNPGRIIRAALDEVFRKRGFYCDYWFFGEESLPGGVERVFLPFTSRTGTPSYLDFKEGDLLETVKSALGEAVSPRNQIGVAFSRSGMVVYCFPKGRKFGGTESLAPILTEVRQNNYDFWERSLLLGVSERGQQVVTVNFTPDPENLVYVMGSQEKQAGLVFTQAAVVAVREERCRATDIRRACKPNLSWSEISRKIGQIMRIDFDVFYFPSSRIGEHEEPEGADQDLGPLDIWGRRFGSRREERENLLSDARNMRNALLVLEEGKREQKDYLNLMRWSTQGRVAGYPYNHKFVFIPVDFGYAGRGLDDLAQLAKTGPEGGIYPIFLVDGRDGLRGRNLSTSIVDMVRKGVTVVDLDQGIISFGSDKQQRFIPFGVSVEDLQGMLSRRCAQEIGGASYYFNYI